jgi:hypothetical protein
MPFHPRMCAYLRCYLVSAEPPPPPPSSAKSFFNGEFTASPVFCPSGHHRRLSPSLPFSYEQVWEVCRTTEKLPQASPATPVHRSLPTPSPCRCQATVLYELPCRLLPVSLSMLRCRPDSLPHMQDLTGVLPDLHAGCHRRDISPQRR